MPVVNALDCQSAVSRFSSVRVRVDRVDLVEHRVAPWATVLQCVRASVVRCIRLARCRHQVAVRWVALGARWVHAQWELVQACRLRAPHRHVRVRVRR
jgi:hypothetical protein